MSHIFIDESGQFTKNGGNKYFVVASFAVEDPRRTEKQFRRWQREKFPRVMRDQPEIKFSEVNIDPELRKNTLRFISSLGVGIRYAYFDCRNIPDAYRLKGKLQSGELYTVVVGETIARYVDGIETELRVFCDQRHLKRMTQAMFKDELTARLLTIMPSKSIVWVEMVESTSNINIQVADWLAGAVAHYLNGKDFGKDYYQILSGNVISADELFKDHWNFKDKQKARPREPGILLK